MKHSPEVAQLVDRLFDIIHTGNVEAVTELIAADDPVIGIGSDPAEWWGTRDLLIKVLRAQVKEMAGMSVEMGAVSAYENGDLGWAAAQTRLGGDDGFDVRFSLVAARSDGGTDWRIVHFHLSVGVSNEDTVGETLTTS
jgi:hypothetical protein